LAAPPFDRIEYYRILSFSEAFNTTDPRPTLSMPKPGRLSANSLGTPHDAIPN